MRGWTVVEFYIQTHSRAMFYDSSSIAGNAADQRGGGVK